MHPVFGKEFVAWLDKFTEQYKIVDPAAGGPDPPGPPGKRKADGQGPEASPKKAKIMDGIVEMSSIKEALIHECKLIGKDAPSLQIRSGHAIYIVNTSPTVEWTSAMGFIAGFGKGSFKFVKNDNPLDDGVIVFNVTSHKDLVVLNGVVLELGKVVMDQREKKPDAQVCYHKMEIANEDPKTFTLTLEHHVAFFPQESDKDAPTTCNNVATKFQTATWASTSNTLAMMWMVRWSTKGLMPVKQVVHLWGSVNLPAGRALRC